jgi:hypothetical protein
LINFHAPWGAPKACEQLFLNLPLKKQILFPAFCDLSPGCNWLITSCDGVENLDIVKRNFAVLRKIGFVGKSRGILGYPDPTISWRRKIIAERPILAGNLKVRDLRAKPEA